MAKMGRPWFESGSMKESSTPVCEKGNGPSSLRQIQLGPRSTSFGILSAEHTMDSSSPVRVIEVKSPFVAHSGMDAFGGWRITAYRPGSWRNLSMRSKIRTSLLHYLRG